MAKFWRSGMIDNKVVMEREQAEYINKLERTILELSREEPDVSDLINDIDYDEVRVGDNVILEFKDGRILAAPRDSVSEALLNFNKQFITTRPKTSVKDAIIDSYSYWLRKNADKRYKADIEFSRKIEALENENYSRTLRQEE
nr:MAG TPA: hypothetical protein [Caudoviricetes sp.]